MKHHLEHAPAFTTLELDLDARESVRAQPDALLCSTAGIEVTGALGVHMRSGGLLGALKSLLTGERLTTAVYTASADAQRLSLVPADPGDILPLAIAPEDTFLVASGAFLACEPGVEIDVRWGGARGLLARTGLFLMRMGGRGSVFLCAHGAIVERVLAPGEQVVVDNRYVVAWSEPLDWQLVKAARELKHAVLSGSGLVNLYTGPGKVYYQTRARPARGGFLPGLFDLWR